MEKPVMSYLNDHMTLVYAVCPGGLLCSSSTLTPASAEAKYWVD